MPKGKPLTDDERREICEARALGESREEIARAYGISASSVTAIVRRYRQKESSMAHRECIVAGNKKNGRLVSTADPHRYEGTCVVAGKAHSRTFTAANAAAATELWSAWCDELRKQQVVVPKQEPQPKAVEPETARVETPMPESSKTEHQSDAANMGDRAYVIWTSGEKPKLFAAYLNMETALGEVDRLNEIASFLGNGNVFEVEELALRS